MKNKEICNSFSYCFSADIGKQYDFFVRRFQQDYNSSHPDARIWRHALYERIFSFVFNGELFSVNIEIVRFLDIRSHTTFTYYSGLFIPFYRFSCQFMKFAVSNPQSEPALEVSEDTIRRWRHILKNASPHNPAHFTVPETHT